MGVRRPCYLTHSGSSLNVPKKNKKNKKKTQQRKEQLNSSTLGISQITHKSTLKKFQKDREYATPVKIVLSAEMQTKTGN